MTATQHLPLTEAHFDFIVMATRRCYSELTPESFASKLTDDELLTFALVNETLLADPAAEEIRTKLTVWSDVMDAINNEIEVR